MYLASSQPASSIGPIRVTTVCPGAADIAGSDWKKTLDFAMRNFKDESFIAQYLSPKLIRDFHFFAVLDDDRSDSLSAAELQAFLGPQQAGTPSAEDIVRRSDINDDGALDYEELRSRIELRFQWMDANKDGNVDPADLREACMVRTFGPRTLS